MKKFIAIYMAPAEEMKKMMAEVKPEDKKKSMDEWMTWAKSHPEIVDLGAPLGKNTRVSKNAVEEVGNDIGGYTFIEAESAEAAAAIFKESPHFDLPGAYVEIMECVSM